MNFCYFLLISVKNGQVVVSKPYPQNVSISQLCDKARGMSLDSMCETTIYKCFIMNPTSTKALYRFNKGLLVRL